MDEEEIIHAGILRKRGGRVNNAWGERYFVLKGHSLYYYLKVGESEPRGSFQLHSTCKISSIRSDVTRRRKQFVFRITWLCDREEESNAASSGTAAASGDHFGSASGTDDNHHSSGRTPQGPSSSAQLAGGSANNKPRLVRAKSGTKDSEQQKDAHKEGKGKSKEGISGSRVAAVTVGGMVLGALTSGVGLLAGMTVVGIGAAAGGGAVALQYSTNADGQKEKHLMLASDSYHDAEVWVNALEGLIADMSEGILGFAGKKSSHNHSSHSLAAMRRRKTLVPRPEVKMERVEEWMRTSKWKVYDVYEGIRILQMVLPTMIFDEESSAGMDQLTSRTAWLDQLMGSSSAVGTSVSIAGGGGAMATDQASRRRSTKTSSTASNAAMQMSGFGGIPACMRVNISVGASPADTFSTVMNFDASLQTGIVKSIRIVENIDNFTDIIHMQLEAIYLYPTWTAPRDFCLMRCWRDNFDGSFVICLDSTVHAECPLVEGYVRGDLHATYLMAPPRAKVGEAADSENKDLDEEESSECMLTFIAQMDPMGWIWQAYGYQRLFLKEFILHALDVRDALDSERFLQVQFDPVTEVKKVAPSQLHEEESAAEKAEGTVATIPPPVLDRKYWMDSDASTFKVRSATYLTDKEKCRSAPALFKLIGIDLFETDGAKHNISSHPNNRVHMARERGEDSWIFLVNIMVPGTPYLNFVSYFLGDKKLIEADTPFGRIARPFFYGNDDEFRNNRFKLIPKIIDGNMVIKMAVKDTPAIIGNKLKQYYYKGDNYFELDVDVGSSSVARNIVGLAIGYSKAIVVDMGFCLQGNEAEELPEVLMGCVSCVRVDMATGIKLN